MRGRVALKHAFVARGILNDAIVRSPLSPLHKGADEDTHAAVKPAQFSVVETAAQTAKKFGGPLPSIMQKQTNRVNNHTNGVTD